MNEVSPVAVTTERNDLTLVIIGASSSQIQWKNRNVNMVLIIWIQSLI